MKSTWLLSQFEFSPFSEIEDLSGHDGWFFMYFFFKNIYSNVAVVVAITVSGSIPLWRVYLNLSVTCGRWVIFLSTAVLTILKLTYEILLKGR